MVEKMLLKRKIEARMLEWKNKYAPEYALFIKGARRVGKTTAAELFGKKEYQSYILVNFQEANDAVKDLFINSLLDLDYFYNVLQLQYQTRLFRRKSLIILDEIQLFPQARQALKTLLNDGRYDFIETGSLAGITKKSRSLEILIPSEEYTIEMYPMDFEEFLWAEGDDFTMNVIKEHYQSLKPFGNVYKTIFRKFREYICVGGMPQAVAAYVQTKDLEKVDFIKREILALYRNDINEQEQEKSEYLDSLLDNLPSELERHDKSVNTYRLYHINKNARIRDYGSAVRWLSEAMIVNIARNTNEPSAALTKNLDDNRFKMYMMDTGLLITLCFNDGSNLDNEFYRAVMSDRLHINEGMIVENVIAQCLRTNGHKIIFYTEHDQNGKMVMDIDFLIRIDRKVIPIEAKSSEKYAVQSLKKFKKKFSPKIGLQYVLHEGDIKRDQELIYLPYFVASIL